jgi:hypothetical protein
MLTNDKRSSFLITSRTHPDIKQLTEIVRKDHQFTGQKIAVILNMDTETARSVLTKDLNMKHI